MRIMGLDYGSKTMGVAISDPLGITAQGITVLRREKENHLRKTLSRMESLIQEYNVEEIVLGFPKKLDNSVGDRAEKTLALKEDIERRTGLPVILWDERLTTVSAHQAMGESGMKKEKQMEQVDMIAAVLILQGYLDRRANQNQ